MEFGVAQQSRTFISFSAVYMIIGQYYQAYIECAAALDIMGGQS